MQGATPVVKGALYDLPDMSTPYVTGAANPSGSGCSLGQRHYFAATAVMNEFWTDPAISAATGLGVFSMPTRRSAQPLWTTRLQGLRGLGACGCIQRRRTPPTLSAINARPWRQAVRDENHQLALGP